MGDAPAGTSLLQSHADIDHRDHILQQQPHHHQHRRLHNHGSLHHRQLDSAVAEVTATVSVTKEIIVDQNGNTQGATLLAASATLDALPSDTTVSAPASAGSAVPIDAPPPALPESLPSLVVTPLPASTGVPPATEIPTTPTDFPVPVTDILNTSTELPVPPVLPLTTPPPANLSPPGSDGLPSSHLSQSLSASQATPLTSAPYLGTNSSSELSFIIVPYHQRLTICN